MSHLRRLLPAALAVLGLVPSIATAYTPAPTPSPTPTPTSTPTPRPAGHAAARLDAGADLHACSCPTPTPVDRRQGITTMTSHVGPAAGGNTLTVNTRSVIAGVTFGGVPAQTVGTSIGDDFVNGIAYYGLTVRVPAGTAGTKVEVRVGSYGAAADPTEDDYYYAADPAPTEPTGDRQCGSSFIFTADAAPSKVLVADLTAPSTFAGTQVTVTPPSAPYGTGVGYPVATGDGRAVGTYRDGCFTPLPLSSDRSAGIASVTPSQRGPYLSTPITVTGYGALPADPTVWFGNTPGRSTKVETSGADGWRITAITPTLTPGKLDVSIRNTSGAFVWGQTGAANDYVALDVPKIRSITPAYGPIAGGNTVRVIVDGFPGYSPIANFYLKGSGENGASSPSVDDLGAGSLKDGTWGAQLLDVVVPPSAGGAAGPAELTFRGQSAPGNTFSTVFSYGPDGAGDYSYTDGPVTEPLEWRCNTFATLTVAKQPDSVAIGGRPATFHPTGTSEITITLPSPAYPDGPDYGVVATTAGVATTIGAYRDGCFSPAPAFDSRASGIHAVILPFLASGLKAGGDTAYLKVYGRVEPGAQVWFGNEQATDVRVEASGFSCIPEAPSCPQTSDGSLITAKVPAATTTGWVDISVRNPSGSILWGQTAGSNDWRYIDRPAIRSVSPARGALAGGNSIKILIDGDWAREPSVTIGGRAAAVTAVTAAGGIEDRTFDSELITVTVPAGAAAGQADVVVRGQGTGFPNVPQDYTVVGSTTAADDYTYEAPAVVPVVTAQSGWAFSGVGGVLLLRGTDLNGVKSVRVGGKVARILSKSATVVYASAPVLTAGAWPVTITTATGTTTLRKLNYWKLF